MTGRYQQRFGLENQSGDPDGLPMQELPLSQMLKPAGYVLRGDRQMAFRLRFQYAVRCGGDSMSSLVS